MYVLTNILKLLYEAPLCGTLLRILCCNPSINVVLLLQIIVTCELPTSEEEK